MEPDDIFQSSEDDEDIQQPRISFEIEYHQYNGRRFQPQCAIHLQGAGGGGRAEEEGEEENDDEEEEEEERGGGGEIEGGVENDSGEANVAFPYNIIGRCSPKKCIFRVPKYIRVIEKRTYTPQTVSIGSSPYTPRTVSIGPYHYGNPKLSRMESQKKLLFESMRCNPDRRPSLKAAMTEFEAKARKCYSTEFNNIDTDAFAEMMLTDAFFIIHTFISFDRWCKNPDDPEVQGEPIFKTPWTQGNICEDLLMLENQLPFFILVQVYAILTNESANCLKKLAMQFFEQVELGRGGCGGDDSEKVADNPKHLLDLFHSSFVVVVDKSKMQKPTKIKDDKSKMQKPKKINNTSSSSSSSLPLLRIKTKYWVSNASALRSNGVSFIGTNKGNPLDIQFNHGIGRLRVPTLCINDRTATVLKNLVAYEQGSRLPNPYFTCLAIFFSNIALNADDIKLLRKADIINHQPADDEAIVLLLQQLNKASQNGFKDCLIKHHLQLIDRYLLSGRARVMSFVRQKGGVENLLFHLSMFFCFTLLFDLIGYGLGVR